MNISLTLNDISFIDAPHLLLLAKLLSGDDDDFGIEEAESTIQYVLEKGMDLAGESTGPIPHASLSFRCLRSTAKVFLFIWQEETRPQLRLEELTKARAEINQVIDELMQTLSDES